MSGAISPLPMYLGGIYRDNFTLPACLELPYALGLADGSKMEHYVGFFMRFVKGKKAVNQETCTVSFRWKVFV
jgi:hypothetical protein